MPRGAPPLRWPAAGQCARAACQVQGTRQGASPLLRLHLLPARAALTSLQRLGGGHPQYMGLPHKQTCKPTSVPRAPHPPHPPCLVQGAALDAYFHLEGQRDQLEAREVALAAQVQQVSVSFFLFFFE